MKGRDREGVRGGYGELRTGGVKGSGAGLGLKVEVAGAGAAAGAVLVTSVEGVVVWEVKATLSNTSLCLSPTGHYKPQGAKTCQVYVSHVPCHLNVT